jgi:hypothetical protein
MAFLQPKIKLAQSNLESIKSTLLLMLNVVSYARNVAQEYVLASIFHSVIKLSLNPVEINPMASSNVSSLRVSLRPTKRPIADLRRCKTS